MSQGDSGMALGLIAGAGTLPIEAARLLCRQGYRLSAVAFEDITDPELAGVTEDIRWVRLGQLESMSGALHELGARDLILAGKVSKALLLENPGVARPDDEALRLLARERDRGDEPLMAAIVDWLEDRGFRCGDQGDLLAPLLAPEGPLGSHRPRTSQLADLAVGWAVARELGRLGVGQSVAVKEGSVLAVEAIEGTDAMIARAGALGGPGATIIKASRPGQDRRFDLPAIGVGTIESMRAVGAAGLAIEAGSTLVVDREATIDAADRANVTVWGFVAGSDRNRP